VAKTEKTEDYHATIPVKENHDSENRETKKRDIEHTCVISSSSAPYRGQKRSSVSSLQVLYFFFF
jgi:hypothetical protein